MTSGAGPDVAARVVLRRDLRHAPPGRGGSRAALVAACGLLLAAVTGALTGAGYGKPVLGILLVVAAVVVLCRVSSVWAASAAGVLALVFPAAQLPVYTELAAFPVAAVPLTIWLIRTRGRPADTPTRSLAALLAAWFAFSWLVGVAHARSGAVLVCLLLVVVCWAVCHQREVDVEKAALWMLRGGTVLAVYAVVEGLALHKNPLMDSLYMRATPPLLQVWSHYRVTTLMGHPLINSVAFAVFAVLALNRVLTTRGTLLWPLSQLVLFSVAEALTETRTGLIAVAVGALVLLAVRLWRYGLQSRLALVGMLISVVFAAFAGPVAARFESQEGAGSATIHWASLSVSYQAIQGRYLEGVGAGEAEASRKLPGGSQPAPLESSYAEIFVGSGVVGLLLFVAVAGWSVLKGLRQPENVGWAAALLTFLVGFGGFNAFEAAHQMTVWLGALMVLATARVPTVLQR